MLRSLVIRDLAVISALELELQPGLTVITGETGAGKSILLDGLTLIAGARAEAAQVRTGAERAELEAEFQVAAGSSAASWLQEQELDGEQESCLLRRRVLADGGSRAWINGRGVSLTQAREFCAELVEIHGQHEYQRLLERNHQLDLLDRYGNAMAARQQVAAIATELRQLQQRRAELEAQSGQAGSMLELVRTQYQELAALKPTRERLAQIEEQQRRLSHADSLLRGLAGAAARLGDEEAGSALKQVRAAQAELSKLLNFDPRLSEILGRLESVRLELDDVSSWLQEQIETLDLDPASLSRIEAELSKFHELARRHRITMTQLPEKLEELQARMGELAGLDAELARLAAATEQARERYRERAQTLTGLRHQGAAKLARAVEKLLADLGMAGARFVVELVPRSLDELASSGAETIEFLVSANAGQPPRPLRKVASGGELSRISLAIKVATIDLADTPVLVFDEVDAGIGGPTAAIVGRKLRTLASKRQVLVVTHSPQVAAAGHQHWYVGKRQQRGQTVSQVQVLDLDGRIEEVARMLAGETVTAQSRASARELLLAASS